MHSNDPIRKAFRPAIEYIDNDGIIINNESIEESADAYKLLYKMRVQFLREDRMDQENEYTDSEDDIDDYWGRRR